jgi:Mg-chelatase subunit ChlD
VFHTGSLAGDMRLLAAQHIHAQTVFVTTETSARSLGFLEELSAAMNCEHYYLEDLL